MKSKQKLKETRIDREPNKTGLTACLHKSKTDEAGAGAKGKRFIQVLHNLVQWWTPVSETISVFPLKREVLIRIGRE